MVNEVGSVLTGLAQGQKPASLLWVNVRLLHPLIGGDRIRTYQMLKHLKRLCHIRYVCPETPDDSEEALARATEYCHELITYRHNLVRSGTAKFYAQAFLNSLFGRRPFSCQKYATPAGRAVIDELMLEAGPNDVAVADYLMSFIHFDGRRRANGPPVVVFQHNLESLIWQRHVEAARDPLRYFVCSRERDLTRRFEDEVARHADGQIAVSPEEEEAFRVDRGMSNVLGWVPTGVDCDYFQPPSVKPAPATMAFLGSMDWHANVDAVCHFVAECYPLIKKQEPDARLILVGRNPTAAVRALAEQDPSIEVTGTIEDVRPSLARASMMILPLRVGGGTRIKVFEGMAAGLTVVSSAIGVEGLPVVNGEHALVADEPEAFAAAVVGLIRNPAERHRIAANARKWVAAEFSWETAAKKFLDLCSRVNRRRATSSQDK